MESKGFRVLRTRKEFTDQAGATGYACLAKAMREDLLDHNEEVVVEVTGNKLKDIVAAKSCGESFGDRAELRPHRA